MKSVFSFFFFITLFFSSCSAQKPSADCTTELKSSFTSVEEGKVIDLRKINCKKWDKLMLIPPSFSKEYIENESQVKLPKEIDYDWTSDGEGHGWWVLLLRKKDVVSYFFVDRKDIDFTKLGSSIKQYDFIQLPKSKSKFISFATGDTFSGSNEKVIDVKLTD